MSEKRDNSGALFKNIKRTKETQPNYTGSCVIDGKEYWMDAWLKDGNEAKFLSVAFKLKQPKQDAKPKQDAFGHSEQREEIPF